MAPKLSAHSDAIRLNPDLFARVDALYQQRDELDLDPESHASAGALSRDFVRSGARLTPEQQDRLREINSRLAELGTEFSQKVLAEVNDSAVVVDSRENLDGLSDAQIERAANEAKDRDLEEGST
jgi:peptidyl-dipeptidase Dcp